MLTHSDYITRYLSFNELPDDAFDQIIKEIVKTKKTNFDGNEYRTVAIFMPIAIYNRGDFHTCFSIDSLNGIKTVFVRNVELPKFYGCDFSVDNRYIIIKYELFGNSEKFDYSETFFSPVSYPILHSIIIGPLQFEFETPLAYNFVLAAMKYADLLFQSGVVVVHERMKLPTFYIDASIREKYDLSIQEDSIKPVRVSMAEVGTIVDYNAILWGNNPPGTLELCVEEWKGSCYKGTLFSNSSTVVSLDYLYKNRNLSAPLLNAMYDSGLSEPPAHLFQLSAEVHSLNGKPPDRVGIMLDARTHDFTLCGNPDSFTLIVWEESDEWIGTIFKLNNLRDYYLVGNWLLAGLSQEKCKTYRPKEMEITNNIQREEFVSQTGNAMAELEQLIGLADLKRNVLEMINFVQMQERRKANGLKTIPVSKHLVFTGNPGTGKTTVARILAKIYHDIGVLSSGHLVEVDRSDLVAGYVGQTAIKTKNKINEALGGILFIDEAYTLNKGGNDFGQEAIDTILKAMEDNRDNFVVIVAGYPDLMKEFINSNPGLRSRFNKYICFQDYSVDELVEIFDKMCFQYDYKITSNARNSVITHIHSLVEAKDDNFANAREIRNIFESIITIQATRIASTARLSNDDMMLLTDDDCAFLHG